MASQQELQAHAENKHDISRGGFTLKSKFVSGSFVGWVKLGGELIRKHETRNAAAYAEKVGCLMKRAGVKV